MAQVMYLKIVTRRLDEVIIAKDVSNPDNSGYFYYDKKQYIDLNAILHMLNY